MWRHGCIVVCSRREDVLGLVGVPARSLQCLIEVIDTRNENVLDLSDGAQRCVRYCYSAHKISDGDIERTHCADRRDKRANFTSASGGGIARGQCEQTARFGFLVGTL